MKKQHFLYLLAITTLLFIAISCGTDDSGQEYVPVSPVVLDLDAAPYDSLSKYKFFEGEMKNLQPAYKVIPYDLNSALFTDYALKKRFIWMPEGVKATYADDGKVLEFPVGTVLIKTFYYDNTVPNRETDIVETRLMIKKATGWVFATYIWNEDHTEAVLNMNGRSRRVMWYQNDATRIINYKIPSAMECALCHKSNGVPVPIGPKPQNINKMYTYADGTENQLSGWVKVGYLAEGYPSQINSTVNWEDTSKPLELRVRSYLDINCGHCHTDGGQCNMPSMNLAFEKTTDPANLGVCVEPHDFVTGDQTHIVAKQNIDMSLLYFRMSNNEMSEMMPMVGRTIVHEEALALIEQWINSMDAPCP
ncbi:hypothetical protein HYN59_09325 [Flavobacterium album]|uniref:Repeat protein (TIGR03806 family) n=1 Tax=Flavobacterium album TaxID=2175091 RepID=A0A2S1QY16_9FLAO|nr:hypothetical protein [Flavobacterium album]AWH85306.1 hypothetical protein HYN59_09325 [Flavobacterium album]